MISRTSQRKIWWVLFVTLFLVTVLALWSHIIRIGNLEGVFIINDETTEKQVVLLNSEQGISVYLVTVARPVQMKQIGWPFGGDSNVEMASKVGGWEHGLWHLEARRLTVEARYWHPETGLQEGTEPVILKRVLNPLSAWHILARRGSEGENGRCR